MAKFVNVKLSAFTRRIGVFAIALAMSTISSASQAQRLPRADSKIMTADQLLTLANREVRPVERPKRPMWVSIPGDLGRKYTTAMSDYKSEIANSGGIDPSGFIEQEVIAALAQRYQLTKGAPLVVSNGRRAPADPSITVDVQPLLWGIEYFGLSWGRYRATYLSTVTITSSGEGGWSKDVFCSFNVPKMPTEATSIDQMLADQSRLLNTSLLTAARQCRDQILPLFGLTGQDVPADIISEHDSRIQSPSTTRTPR